MWINHSKIEFAYLATMNFQSILRQLLWGLEVWFALFQWSSVFCGFGDFPNFSWLFHPLHLHVRGSLQDELGELWRVISLMWWGRSHWVFPSCFTCGISVATFRSRRVWRRTWSHWASPRLYHRGSLRYDRLLSSFLIHSFLFRGKKSTASLWPCWDLRIWHLSLSLRPAVATGLLGSRSKMGRRSPSSSSSQQRKKRKKIRCGNRERWPGTAKAPMNTVPKKTTRRRDGKKTKSFLWSKSRDQRNENIRAEELQGKTDEGGWTGATDGGTAGRNQNGQKWKYPRAEN